MTAFIEPYSGLTYADRAMTVESTVEHRALATCGIDPAIYGATVDPTTFISRAIAEGVRNGVHANGTVNMAQRLVQQAPLLLDEPLTVSGRILDVSPVPRGKVAISETWFKTPDGTRAVMAGRRSLRPDADKAGVRGAGDVAAPVVSEVGALKALRDVTLTPDMVKGYDSEAINPIHSVPEAAIKAGATTINIPDTVGYTSPAEYQALFRTVRERVPNSDKAIFSVHCHNDLGMAVATSLAGLAGGARQIECTVNGIGERAGNAALEEIVMAIDTRPDAFPYQTGINTRMLTRASKLVSAVTSFPVQYNKAIVGRNAFAHESGIHQDGMLKHTQTYEIMTPESVGVSKTSLVMGKHSGRAAFRDKLRTMGYELGENALNDAFTRFKDLADRKKMVYDEDIEALVDQEIAAAHDRIRLISLSVIAGTRGPQRATMRVEVDGRVSTEEAEGNGPVDATFNAIKALVPHTAKLELYQVHAVTEGTDAQAEVSVRLEENGKVVTARSADPDTLVASAQAYITALNKLQMKRQSVNPQSAVG